MCVWYKTRQNIDVIEMDKSKTRTLLDCFMAVVSLANTTNPKWIELNVFWAYGRISYRHNTRYILSLYGFALSSPHSQSFRQRCAILLTGETHTRQWRVSFSIHFESVRYTNPSRPNRSYRTLFVSVYTHGKWFLLSLWSVNQQMPHASALSSQLLV